MNSLPQPTPFPFSEVASEVERIDEAGFYQISHHGRGSRGGLAGTAHVEPCDSRYRHRPWVTCPRSTAVVLQ